MNQPEKPAQKTILNLSLTALFTALIAAGAFIVIPVGISPVPIVLQNLFVVLAGLVLGPSLAVAATISYLVIGLIGAPIFAGARGGLTHLLGPTGGFLVGYILAALLSGWLAGQPPNEPAEQPWRCRLVAAALLGFAVIYLPGLIRLKAILASGWLKTLAVGAWPFIPGDLIKLVLVLGIAPRLRRLRTDLFNV